MIAFTLDRSKRWRLLEWAPSAYIFFNGEFWCWHTNHQYNGGPSDLSGDWEECQPEPELEWRFSIDHFYLASKESKLKGRSATEAELKAIRRSLGIKE